MLLMLYCLRENPSRYRSSELDQEEVEWYSEKKSSYTHDVLRDKENDKNDWRRNIERLTNEPWIEEISFNHVDKSKHDNNRDHYAPPCICRYASKKYRYATDKYSQDRDEARQKSDTSECEEVWKE